MAWDEAGFKRLIRGESCGPMAAMARSGLWLASVPYGWAMRARNLAFDQGWRLTIRASAPVISVGNLTVGGTGKTPVVEYLARRLREKGIRVTLLSRGYGNDDGCNDEALLLEQNLPDVPHLQGRDRVQLAHIAIEELESEILLLDDGFQHRRLGRDLDVVLIDATDPFGGGRLLPAGLLREPVSSLRRAHLICITRCDTVPPAQLASIRQRAEREAGTTPIVLVRFRPTALIQHGHPPQPIENLHRKRVAAFSGIGNPSSFCASLATLGSDVIGRRDYPDHHAYTREDIESLTQWARETKPDLLVTTQKDFVKIPIAGLAEVPLVAVKIEAQVVEGSESVEHALERVLASSSKPLPQESAH